MKDEYLTIAEFAKQAGVTRQAVYKRLSADLFEFTKVDNGTKLINSRALRLFGVEPVSTELTHTFTDLAAYFDKQNETLSRLVDTLEDELAIKNKQIEASNDRQRELSIMLDQQQKLNAHALLTGSSGSDEAAIEQKYRDRFQDQMQHIAQLLLDQYPEAAEYLIKELEKEHQ